MISSWNVCSCGSTGSLEEPGKFNSRIANRENTAVLLEQDVAYDTLIQVMDTVRVSQEVNEEEGVIDRSELFPEISIGDAPVQGGGTS